MLTMTIRLRMFAASMVGIVAGSLLAEAALAQRRSNSDEPLKVEQTTKDGVSLEMKYFPSSEGKDAVPVIMLHDERETSAVFSKLAERLHAPGKRDTHKSFAVLTIDLRGHGGSVTQTYGNRTRQIEASRLNSRDVQAMVGFDMEAARKFLVTENDAGKLNLNRLSIIGTGLGAMVGINWAARDWAAPPLARIKQGQDVKAMVLVSPRWKKSGLSLQLPLKQPGIQSQVATMILYGGGNRRVARDAERFYDQLERHHKDLQPPTKSSLPMIFKSGPDTELQGTEWLKMAGPKAEDLIIRFLTQYAAEKEYEWSKRRAM